MNASVAVRLFAFFFAGFIAVAVVMLVYGLLLGAIWPYVYEVDWPSLGSNPREAIVRAQVLDASIGIGSGALLALALAAASKSSSLVPAACSFAGMTLYAYSSASASTNMLAGFLESPLPTLLAAFLVTSLVVIRRRSVATR